MNWRLVARLEGLLALLIGAAMALSLPWSFAELGEASVFEARAFRGMCRAVAACVIVGACLYAAGRRAGGATLLRKEALAVVGLGWILSGLLGSLPYLLTPTYRSPGVEMSVSDAVFESVSGFTTTGASVLSALEPPEGVPNPEDAAVAGLTAWVPRSVLFWRSLTHWLGGMGIIVLFVAVLGRLGAAGKALMKREVPGPLTDNVRPRVRDTAVAMWSIYLGLSGLMAVILWLQGLSVFESLCHTFGTLATGGFSTRNASVGSFQSSGIEFTIILFMVAAGVNFNLYYLLLSTTASAGGSSGFRRRFNTVLSDPELRLYFGIITVVTGVLTVTLLKHHLYAGVPSALRHALFNTVAVMTTTGFGTEDFSAWPETARAILLLLMFVGGCSGSTGGGVKVIRFLLLFRTLKLEAERAFVPNLIKPVRLGGVRLEPAVTRDVVVYFALVVLIAAGSWLLLMVIEPDTQWAEAARQRPAAHHQNDTDGAEVDAGETTLIDGMTTEEHNETATHKMVDCAGAVAATLNNIGPGLGVCGPHANYAQFSGPAKVLLTVLMLLGRLELFAILVLFSPGFWSSR